jgi:type IV secretion system protein VirB2
MSRIILILQAILTEPQATGVIDAAVGWVTGLVFGSLTTVLMTIAIAWLGLSMMSGRIDVRRGLYVILGCFIIIGAREIASGLQASSVSAAESLSASAPAQPSFPKAGRSNTTPNNYDPYAGASIRQQELGE